MATSDSKFSFPAIGANDNGGSVGRLWEGAARGGVTGDHLFPFSKNFFSALTMASCLGLWCLCNEKWFPILFCPSHSNFSLMCSLVES